MEWLDEVLDKTKESECPRSFILWSALYVISSIVKKNVHIKRPRIYDLYPNLYVLVIAPSGMRKQFSIDMAAELLSMVGITRVIGGRNSIQSILQELSKPCQLEGGTLVKNAEGALLSGEFSNLVIDDPASLTILTQLHDTYSPTLKEWKNSLKGAGKETLKNVYLTMFGATNPKHFKDRIAEKDVEGGFIARTICVYENKQARINAAVDYGDDIEELSIDYKSLIPRLMEISNIKGRFVYSREAGKFYEDWYNGFCEHLPEDKTGFANRVADHATKVAMLISLSRKDELILGLEEMQYALSIVLPLIKVSNEIAAGGIGESKFKVPMAVIIQELMKAPNYTISRQQLINKHWRHFTADDLNIIKETLLEGGYMVESLEDNKVMYRLSDRCIAELEAK